MTGNVTIQLYAIVPLCAAAGTLLGLDAHTNRWSRWPLWVFAILGSLVGFLVVVYLLQPGGSMP